MDRICLPAANDQTKLGNGLNQQKNQQHCLQLADSAEKWPLRLENCPFCCKMAYSALEGYIEHQKVTFSCTCQLETKGQTSRCEYKHYNLNYKD